MKPEEIKVVLSNFIAHLDRYIKLIEQGAASTINIPNDLDLKQIFRIFLKRFRTNIYTLMVLEKDPLLFTLLQRYNHEMLLDFYFLSDPTDQAKKITQFATYSGKLSLQKWGNYQTSDKRPSVPPWVGDKESFRKVYKWLSNLAHPNILSITLGVLDDGGQRKNRIMTEATALCIFEISICLDCKGFRDIFGLNGIQEDLYLANLGFQNTAGAMLISDK